MRSIWIFVLRLWCYWFVRLHGYQLWSHLYRRIWERGFEDRPLKMFATAEDLENYLYLNRLKWRSDSWKQLGDAVSYPQTAQAVFDDEYDPPHGCDCDEFAIFATNSIERGLAMGVMKAGDVSEPKFMTVTWLNGWKASGHNVCLVKLADGSFAYLDYGSPEGASATVGEVARKVVDHYASTNATLLSFAVQRSDLSPEVIHWGESSS